MTPCFTLTFAPTFTFTLHLHPHAQDPLLIEKKIRAVQKKLRRVQTIEQQAGVVDSGQQVRKGEG